MALLLCLPPFLPSAATRSGKLYIRSPPNNLLAKSGLGYMQYVRERETACFAFGAFVRELSEL